MTYELVQKPTFLNQLRAVPAKELHQVLAKVELLQKAPQPDGKNKKRLVGYKGAVYRIRSGDYRILYTFGEGWVTLLGVDHRKDVYEGDQLVAEKPGFDLNDLPADGLLVEELSPSPSFDAPDRRTDAADELPVKIDRELLEKLRIPDEYIAALVGCKTVDDLTAAAVPEAIMTRVFDVVTSPDYDRVMEQPSLIAEDVDDLLRFAEGELVPFLLKLDPEQEKFVDWALSGSGPTLVKGGPGTGKSTVALYRTRALVQALRQAGISQPRVLFTTYTNALAVTSQQLLARLLGPDAGFVSVRTADNLVMEIVTAVDGRPIIIQPAELQAAFKEALATAVFDGNALQRRGQAQTIERLAPEYLLEEIGSVIEARELATLKDYLAAGRAGRRVPLNATQRTAVWRVYEAFVRALKRRNQPTWEQLRRRAVEIVRAGKWPHHFDGVVVDEAQDLDPTVLRLLVELCRDPNRMFITADANQSIYGSGFRWTDIHEDLDFRGRTGVLRRNYRSTLQVDRAAKAYLDEAVLDQPEPGVELSYVRHDGVMPAVRAFASAFEQTQLLVRFVRQATRAFRLGIGACAILVPTEEVGKSVASWLNAEGIAAEFMPGRALDLEKPVVKVLTLKSAKGLEFPIVALAGFDASWFPGIPQRVTEEELAEALAKERRTMYVGMTRAMLALLVALPSAAKPPAASLYTGFSGDFWNVTGVSAVGSAG